MSLRAARTLHRDRSASGLRLSVYDFFIVIHFDSHRPINCGAGSVYGLEGFCTSFIPLEKYPSRFPRQPRSEQESQATAFCLIALYHTTNPQHLSPRDNLHGRQQHHCHKSRAAISESFAVPRSGSVPLTSVFALFFSFFLFSFLFPVYLILSGRQSSCDKRWSAVSVLLFLLCFCESVHHFSLFGRLSDQLLLFTAPCPLRHVLFVG